MRLLQRLARGFPRHLTSALGTLRIVHTSLFVFFYYLMIGLLLAVLPGFVHFHLGLWTLPWTSSSAIGVFGRARVGSWIAFEKDIVPARR
jgi:hypothetical protein